MSAGAVESIASVGAAVSYLRVVTDEAGGGPWLGCQDLLDDPDALLDVVRGTKDGIGTDRDDVAMSLFVQGYVFRVASLAIGAWLLDDVVLDVAPSRLAVAIARSRPNAVRSDDPQLVEVGEHGDVDRASPYGAVPTCSSSSIDGHLAPLVATAPAGPAGSASGCSGRTSARRARRRSARSSPRFPDRRTEIRDRAEAFFAAARPELAGSGRLVRVGGRWAWERNELLPLVPHRLGRQVRRLLAVDRRRSGRSATTAADRRPRRT